MRLVGTIILFFIGLTLLGLDTPVSIEPNKGAGNYIVVAAYGKSWESLAKKFTEEVSADYPDVTYSYFEGKNMYMVYVEYSNDFDYSVNKMREIRKGGKYLKTWVFVYKGDNNSMDEMEKEVESDDQEEPVTVVEEETVIVESEDEQGDVEVAVIEEEVVEEEIIEPEENLGKYKMFFKVYNSQNLETINAEVGLIDPTRGKQFDTVMGNELVRTDGPNNSTSDIQAVSEYFGFRKVIHTFNLDEPMVDSTEYFVKVAGDSLLIDMPLVKFRKGDIFTLFHVYFFSHSAVMKPQSQYELNQLLAMMNDNPDLKIKLHGHTNGSSKGLTRYHELEDPEFFTLSGTVEKTSTAKELSEMRAEEVKRYLVDQNIDPSRIEVIGWGGRKMLYNKLDQNADRNVRVEVEIVSE